MRFVAILMLFAIGCEAQVQVERPAKKTVEVKPSPAPRDIEMPKATGDYAIVKIHGTLNRIIDRDGVSFEVVRNYMRPSHVDPKKLVPGISTIHLYIDEPNFSKAVHLHGKRVFVYGTYYQNRDRLDVDDLEEAK